MDEPRPHHGRVVVALTLVSALSALSPLLALPFIARAAGPDGFLNIATGQAIGTLAATVLLYGWQIRGPVLVSRSAEPVRIYWTSLVSRGLLAVLVLPAAALIAVLATVAGDAWLTALSALAFTTPGLTITWYAIGTGRPVIAAAFDTLPRLVANLAGGLGAFALAAPWLYPAAILVAAVAAQAAFALWTAARSPRTSGRVGHAVLESYRENWRVAATGGLLTFSETAPLMSLGIAASPVATAFAPFDRLLKYGYIGVYMITNSFQGWVSSASGVLAVTRMRRAVAMHVALGVALGAGFALVGPLAVPLVLGPEFALDPATAAFGGVALAAMAIAAALGLCVLTPAGDERRYLFSVSVGAVLIVPAVLLGAALGGLPGAAAGVAGIQLVVLALAGALAARRLRPARGQAST